MNTLHMHILEISWLCTMTEPRCTDTPVAMSTPSCRILALKYHYPRAETGGKKRYAWWWCQWKWESKNPLLHKINENTSKNCQNHFFKTLKIDHRFFKGFIYLFLERGEGREKKRQRTIDVWLPLARPPLWTWPTTQACALTGNQTDDLLVSRMAFNPLSHTSQGLSIGL